MVLALSTRLECEQHVGACKVSVSVPLWKNLSLCVQSLSIHIPYRSIDSSITRPQHRVPREINNVRISISYNKDCTSSCNHIKFIAITLFISNPSRMHTTLNGRLRETLVGLFTTVAFNDLKEMFVSLVS